VSGPGSGGEFGGDVAAVGAADEKLKRSLRSQGPSSVPSTNWLPEQTGLFPQNLR